MSKNDLLLKGRLPATKPWAELMQMTRTSVVVRIANAPLSLPLEELDDVDETISLEYIFLLKWVECKLGLEIVSEEIYTITLLI